MAMGAGRALLLSRSIGRTVESLLWYARTTRIVVGVLGLVALGLLGTPQAVDLLITLGQDAAARGWVVLAGSLLWLGLNAWFWSRFILGIRFPRDTARLQSFPPAYRRQRALVRGWLPRALGLAPFLAVAAALLAASSRIPDDMQIDMSPMENGSFRLQMAAVAVAVFGCVFFYTLTMRRAWLRRLHRRLASNPSARSASIARAIQIAAWPRERPAAFHAVRPAAWLLLALSLVAAVVAMLLYGMAPVATARYLPAAPTILFAAAGMICVGTLLVFLGAQSRLPILSTLLAGALTLAALRDTGAVADNHDIRTLPGQLAPRPGLRQAFTAFLASSRVAYPAPAAIPVVLVATSGGGLAAAFWTATVLGDLADAQPKFAEQIFAISAVSGGALGALEFVAGLGTGPAGKDCIAGGLGDFSVRRCTQAALSADFLGPTLGAMLYPDLFQRFVPVPIFQDRAVAIEQAWETRWRSVFHNDRLAAPFLDLWQKQRPWPALLLNGTSFFTGGRIVASNIALNGQERVLSADATDLLALTEADIPASTAANASARFPYVGPVGTIRRQGQERLLDAVVDGGYFENFGATTLLDILVSLDRIARDQSQPVRFIVLQLVSVPDIAMDSAERITATQDTASRSVLPRGIVAPLATLLRTRGARGLNATENLARATLALGGTYIPIRLGISPTGATAPLGWSLSATARRVIDEQWTQICRNRLLGAMALDATPTQDTMTPALLARDFMSMLMTPVCRPAEVKDGVSPGNPLGASR